MIFELLAIYGSILLGCVISTTCLIILGKNWGALPHYYLKSVAWIQTFYPDVYPESDVPWPAIIKRITWLFRWGFLFPIRLGLLLTSFAFLIVAGLMYYFQNVSDAEKTWFGIICSRLFLSGMGIVVTYNNIHFRPKEAGVAVSNHMSPNDVQALFAGTPLGSSHGFIVTGQKHSGIIGSIEAAADRICPTIWVDRKSAKGRREFFEEIMKKFPILLFPEGYCSNNTQVLQFRRAIFKEGITIYPIAIK
uniref:PlsC domain-containing protein n=1 Tax=Angiostrongylus cantonensis TaxID=6313 RepID=A0A158PC08_ANGCA